MAPIERARACIGTRFRLHGRSRDHGLDCIGLAALAYGWSGVAAGYALRGDRLADLADGIDATGMARGEGDPAPGDLLLVRPGPWQLHLAILTDRGFVHADAGLRRVVETPGAPLWLLIAFWRPA